MKSVIAGLAAAGLAVPAYADIFAASKAAEPTTLIVAGVLALGVAVVSVLRKREVI